MMNQIYQYAIDQVSIVSVTDINGSITYINQNFCDISGFSREELLGEDHRMLNSGYHSKGFFREIWEHLLGGRTWKGDICNRAKDGNLYWVKSTITPILNKEGKISEMISICEDITTEKLITHLFREKNKTLKFLLDSQHAGFFQYIFKEDRLKYEDNFLNILGRTRDNFGNSFDDLLSLFSEKERTNLEKKIRNNDFVEDETFQFITIFKRGTNNLRTIHIYGKVITVDKLGHPEVLVAVVNDFTEKNKLEGLLSRTEEVARIGSWELNLDDHTFILSPMTYKIYGYEPYSFEPTLELFIEKIIPPEYGQQLKDAMDKLKSSEGNIQIDLPAITRDKTIKWLRHIIYSEKVDEGTFKAVGTTQDINTEKMLELSLKQSAKKVDMALETAGFGIWEFFYDDKRLVMDDFLKGLMGLDYLEREIDYCDIKRTIIEEDFEKLLKKYKMAIKSNIHVVNIQFRVIKNSAEVTFIQSRGIVEYNDRGRAVSLLGLCWDITKDKEFENILIETKNTAEEATNMKSAFLASMSHEIRTPMNGVLGMMELLLDTDLTREQQKLLDTMKVSSENLLTVVNDVLDLSKIEAGKMDLEYRKFNLRDMLINICDFFKVTAQKKGIALNIQLTDELPTYIEMDEVRLRQVLNNLLSNALKFTAEGSIDLIAYPNRPSHESSTASSGRTSISFIIKDTGIGIADENMDKLFSSFTQVDTSITRKFGGTGLGLTISKSLVERMGGDIRVTSQYGKGTTFKFNILCDYFCEVKDEVDKIKKQNNHNYRKDLRILVAEDHPINQMLVKRLFKKLDLDVDIAENGEVALEMVKNNNYHVVFMDLQMPKMDGITATQKIMSSDSITDKPMVMAMTANVFEEDKNRCWSVGMSDFVAKPLSGKVLVDILIKHFPNFDSTLETSVQPMTKLSKYKLINEEQILFEFSEDFDIFEELIHDYQAHSTQMIDQIKNAYKNGDSETVCIVAHTLKGVVSNFYSKELTDAAFQMEMAGKNRDLTKLDQQLQHFLNYNDGILAELSDFVQKNKTKRKD